MLWSKILYRIENYGKSQMFLSLMLSTGKHWAFSFKSCQFRPVVTTVHFSCPEFLLSKACQSHKITKWFGDLDIYR